MVMEGNAERPRGERGREGVLPRHFHRRAQELPDVKAYRRRKRWLAYPMGRPILRRAETRDRERVSAKFDAIARAVARAGPQRLFRESLERRRPRRCDHRARRSPLCLSRARASCMNCRRRPPFGGLNATPAGGLARIFMSPGPIYDPEGRGPDSGSRHARCTPPVSRGRRGSELLLVPPDAGGIDVRDGVVSRWLRGRRRGRPDRNAGAP